MSLQYQQILEDFNEWKYFSLDLSLVDGNPFAWDATYFGRPGTHLDGGVFNIQDSFESAVPTGTAPSVFQNAHRSSRLQRWDVVLSYWSSWRNETSHSDDCADDRGRVSAVWSEDYGEQGGYEVILGDS
jgi:hypothetical protein